MKHATGEVTQPAATGEQVSAKAAASDDHRALATKLVEVECDEAALDPE
jgi:hypothetical protein